jgi:hypothetical protein
MARKAKESGKAASQLVDDLVTTLDGDRVTVGTLLKNLEGRGLGLILLILSLPMCVPNIPGISTLFGLLLIGPSFQMVFGNKTLWMPGFVKRWLFKGKDLRKALRACGKLLHKLEYLAKPRLTALTSRPGMIYAGLQTLVMALVLLLPMPGANFLPGIAVALTGLGVLQRDGIFMLAAMAVSVGTLVFVYVFGRYAIEVVVRTYERCVNLLYEISLSFDLSLPNISF